MQPERLAILDRGDAAARCLRTLAELSPEERPTSVAVVTTAGRDAWYVQDADEIVVLDEVDRIPPGHVVAALQAADVDAIWVGWGGLAEDAGLVAACEDAGLTVVGAASGVLRRLADRHAAKESAQRLGLPVVPWCPLTVADVDETAETAAALGYPLAIKTACGSGATGVRMVTSQAELPLALETARAEALRACGAGTLFLERKLEPARSVRVQIVADGHGTCRALGVHDAWVGPGGRTLLVETSGLPPAVQDEVREAAIRLCRDAGLVGVASVEFLADPTSHRWWFLEVEPGLSREHAVTEARTGLDLVALQLRIAAGGSLPDVSLETRGHALHASLQVVDPQRGGLPVAGRLLVWRPGGGADVRIDAAVAEGDRIEPQGGAVVASVVVHAADRPRAIARLARVLRQTLLVVEGGATTKSALTALLGRDEFRAGTYDPSWLDRLEGVAGHLDLHTGPALAYAAVDAYEADRRAHQEIFFAEAARGRPRVPDAVGLTVELWHWGDLHRFTVARRGADRYRLQLDGRQLDVQVQLVGRVERRLELGGRTHRVVAHRSGPELLVEIDGVEHRLRRHQLGTLRADAPALVVAVLTSPGSEVVAGEPLVVLESMKMEHTLAAPVAGRVAAVHVRPHVYVDPGAALVEIDVEPAPPAGTDGHVPVDLPLTDPVDESGRDARQVVADLEAAQLGYDVDLTRLRGAVDAWRPDGAGPSPRAQALAVVARFSDLATLTRREPDEQDPDLAALGAEQEHLRTYLMWVDPDRSGVPARFRRDLERVLTGHGVTGLERTPALEEALFWTYRSFTRLGELAPMIATLVERLADARTGDDDATFRRLLDRLIATSEGRFAVVSDVARDLRFRRFDEPVLDRARAEVYATMAAVIDELDGGPEPDRREELMRELVACHQPLRAMLRDRFRRAGPELRRVLLEVNLRRFYRIRPLEGVRTVDHAGTLLGVGEYQHDGRSHHLVTAYGDAADLDRLLASIADHARRIPAERPLVLGLSLWRAGELLDIDELSRLVAARLTEGWSGRPLHRVDVTVTTEGGAPEHMRTQHVTFRHRGTDFVEEVLYRNLHPMMAKRLELWRLEHFELERLRSVEDVFLFRIRGRENPRDERLIAVAEVRDLTPVVDGEGRIVALPHLERMALEALHAIRQAQAGLPARDRLVMNRVILHVRPELRVPAETWRDLAHALAPATIGLGLEKVVLRVRIPAGDGAVTEGWLHVENITALGVSVRLEPVTDQPMQPLTGYGQRLLKARRMGLPYPYELVKQLAPPAGTSSDFPTGDFVEYDLATPDDDRLVPADREPARNSAGIVVGVIRNATAKVPEGMRRVVLLGDPTLSLGSLAEAECRRIIGAIDLAEQERLPLEWFALSAGARISMSSGTENMDWIGAVLRRIIEFTQAGGEINVVVAGINVGAQPYWNAEATMLMHTRGILVMTPSSAMVLTGKQSLDFSGGVSAEDNVGIGGYERIMGPNAQGQYWAPTLEGAYEILLRHYEHTYVVPGERFPRRARTADPLDRDVREHPHAPVEGTTFRRVGDVFSADTNPDRKQPFDIRSVMRAVSDGDHEPLERWRRWRDADMAVVWDAHVGGIPVCMLGIESRDLPRQGFVPADGPPHWTSGTLFPQASRKVARAINAASGNRPVVVLANLSGFDGSPESMRKLQLEFGAEIGRAVTNFRGPIVFVVVSRYHGGAFVVFSKTLNAQLEIAAVEGSFASVIGGAPAAGVVFAREVTARAAADERVVAARQAVADGTASRSDLDRLLGEVRIEKLGEMANEFDAVHSIQRALQVGSVDRIITPADLRPYVVDALERGMAASPT